MTALAVGLVVPLSGITAATAGAQADGGTEVLATLKVEQPKVEVKKKGADNFKAAKDGQKLREGDTVRTDATGRAEIDYSDDAYTRLDVNTTFTITKLTEEQGSRQVEGSLDSGRTWNRTEAITESGSFEQSGGGATAAVVGTAFMVTCESATSCEFLGVYNDLIVTGADGEVRQVPERGECSSDAGDLCDVVRELTVDEMAAITWIQENLFRDLVEHGFGPGPFIPSFNVVVENGVVVAVTPIPPSEPPATTTTTTTSTSTTTTTTTLPPVAIDPLNPVIIEGGGGGTPAEFTPPVGPAPRIETEDEVAFSDPVQFTINVTGPDGHIIMVVFSNLPTGNPNTGTGFGVIGFFTDGPEPQFTPVVEGVEYDAAQVFTFRPTQHEPGGDEEPFSNTCNNPPPTSGNPPDVNECWGDYPDVFPNFVNNLDGTVQWSQSFTVTPHDLTAGVTGDAVDIEIVVVDDVCNEPDGEPANRVACDLAGGPGTFEESGAEIAPAPTARTTAAPATTLPPAPPETAPTTVATIATTTTLAPF